MNKTVYPVKKAVTHKQWENYYAKIGYTRLGDYYDKIWIGFWTANPNKDHLSTPTLDEVTIIKGENHARDENNRPRSSEENGKDWHDILFN